MDIKPADVKTLREKTGAGMMDCKKALVEAGGDFAKAEKILKELGLAAAAKRSGRATNEGRIFAKVGAGRAALLELACETDFVSRNADFIRTGEEIIASVVAKNLKQADAEVLEKVQKMRTTIRENIDLRRFKVLEAGKDEAIVEYIHGEGRIGVLVKVKADKPEALTSEVVKTFAFDTALHIAAYNPMFLSRDRADQAYIKEQEEIFTKQAELLGKPANVSAGIAKGKLNKHLAEICLNDQPFVKNDKLTVSQMAAQVSKDAGAKVVVSDYLYFRVGEEI